MPINPLIAMSGQNIDTANPLLKMVEIQQAKKDNEYRDKQMAYLDKKLEAETVKTKAEARNKREESVLTGAATLANLFDQGDDAGAAAYLERRRQTLIDEGIDTSDTDEAIGLLQSDPEKLKAISRAGREEAISRKLVDSGDYTLGATRFTRFGKPIASNEQPKPPTLHDFVEGDKTVTKQWDDKSGTWIKQSEGARFAPPAPDNTLVEIADASSPTGTRLVPRAQAVNQPGKPPSGMNVEVGPDGTVRMTQGRGAGGLTNSTQAAVEKSAIDTGSMLSQVRSFADRFNPEFFTYGGRLDRKVKGVRASVDPASLNPEERKKYEEAASYASDLGRVQAQQINELYGAALSAGENERAKAFIVNPGDDPVVAEQKIQGYEKYLRRTQAKLSYIRKNGLSVEGVSVDDMPEIMNNRAREIEAELAKTKAGDDLRKAVSRQLAEEFGLLQ